MKAYHIFLIYLIIVIIVALFLTKNCKNNIEKIIFGWTFFATLIAILEFHMIYKHDYMKNESTISNENWWLKEYKFSDSFTYQFWLDAWREYAKEDNRYLMWGNHVIWLEFFHILAIPFMWYICWKIWTNCVTKNTKIISIIVGTIIAYGTMLYYMGCFTENNNEFSRRCIAYLSLNSPWIIFPIIFIYFGIDGN